MTFLDEAWKKPGSVGAIAPTSRLVAEQMARLARISHAARIIELGAGTGAITAELRRQMPESARLLAIERHPLFAAELARRFPGIQVAADCASRVRAVALEQDFAEVDAVVSTLPWIQFSGGLQRRILTDIRGLLSLSGVFVTAVCFGPHWLAGGQSFRHHLEETFGRVVASPVSFRNFPPLFIYVCHRIGAATPAAPPWPRAA